MRLLFRLVRQQFLGATALFLVVGGFAMAKTGDPLRLGLVNNANAPTTIVQSKAGPALALRAKPGQPALKVNTTKAIQHLNASLLRGKKPGDFAAAGSSYTKAEADLKFPRIVLNTNFFGETPADTSEVTVPNLSTLQLPCTGTLTLTVALEESADDTTDVFLYVGGVRRGQARSGPDGGTIYFAMATPPVGPLDVSIRLKSTDTVAGSVAGNLVGVLYPWC